MKTKAKVWLGIGGYLAGQAVAAGICNVVHQGNLDKFNTKYEQVQDLYYSKKNDLTEDKQNEIRERLDSIHDNVETEANYMQEHSTILITVGTARIIGFKKRLKESIKVLKRIEDDLNGIVIDSEVKTS